MSTSDSIGPSWSDMTHLRVVEDKAGRSVDGYGARIGRWVWLLTTVQLECLELGLSKGKAEAVGRGTQRAVGQP